jgi:D-alanine-D-alanine ligase
MLCKNKSLMKKLLSFHHVRTPRFDVFYVNRAVNVPSHLRFPLIVKPAKEDASYGIAQSSFVRDKEELVERVRFLHTSMNQNALVEVYVDGRELTVGVVGNDRLVTYAPREVVFREVPDTEPKIATFRAKWDEDYRKRWGIQNRFADPLVDGLAAKMATIAKRAYRTLHIHGYGRIDMRLTEGNEIMVIEANPNPAIGRDEDLAMSAAKAGVAYPDLIQRLLHLALAFATPKK